MSPKLVNQLIITVSAILLLGLGFWAGIRYSTANYKPQDLKINIDRTATTVSKEVLGVQWIKSGENPTCDADHPVKGRVDSGLGYYYTNENKNYAKIKPSICFANEDVAKLQAGYIKKY
jgi:hypothetical protein